MWAHLLTQLWEKYIHIRTTVKYSCTIKLFVELDPIGSIMQTKNMSKNLEYHLKWHSKNCWLDYLSGYHIIIQALQVWLKVKSHQDKQNPGNISFKHVLIIDNACANIPPGKLIFLDVFWSIHYLIFMLTLLKNFKLNYLKLLKVLRIYNINSSINFNFKIIYMYIFFLFNPYPYPYHNSFIYLNISIFKNTCNIYNRNKYFIIKG